MNKLLIFLLPTMLLAGPKNIQRHVSWDRDINSLPLPGQIQDDIEYLDAAYEHMRDKINEQNKTIRVLNTELHTYMIRTDLIVQRLEKLEKKAFKKPWYKRMFSCFKK